jgi:hypothetical protein
VGARVKRARTSMAPIFDLLPVVSVDVPGSAPTGAALRKRRALDVGRRGRTLSRRGAVYITGWPEYDVAVELSENGRVEVRRLAALKVRRRAPVAQLGWPTAPFLPSTLVYRCRLAKGNIPAKDR